MDNGVVAVQASPATGTSLYFCGICSKPFSRETSHARHVQYCRRRAARKQPTRPKACHFCRKTKSKCDFSSPCSRCVSKRATCSYGAQHDTTTGARRNGAVARVSPAFESMDMMGDWDVSSVPFESVCPITPFLDLDLGSDLGIPHRSLEFNDEDTRHDSAHPLLDEDTLPSAAFISDQPDTALSPPSDPITDAINPYLVTKTGPNDSLPQAVSERPRSKSAEWTSHGTSVTHLYGTDPPTATDIDIISLVPVPSRTISIPEQSPGRRLSTGCRRYILSILRTYPRMMARPNNLPPFIHPLGCGLYFDSRDARASEPAAFAPLKPLAACHGIARIFASRGLNTSEFLWRTIDSEHRMIVDEMQQYSRGEILASIQAISVYTIMRVIDSGRGYFVANRDLLKAMKRLGHRFGQLCPGPTSPPHKRHSRPSWEEWMLEETRRRISIVCFIVALVVGSEGSPSIANPSRLPLPSGRALWEAKSAWEWEREYDAAWGQSEGVADRLETVGDLSMAQLRRGGGDSWGMPGDEFGGAGDDALDRWHAGVDGLGMLLAAVIADV